MPKHPKPIAESSTALTRLTPQEIDALRESAHRMSSMTGTYPEPWTVTQQRDWFERFLLALPEPVRAVVCPWLVATIAFGGIRFASAMYQGRW